MFAKQIALDLDVEDVGVEVFLNGIPLTRLGAPGRGGQVTIPATQFALEGRNRLDVVVGEGGIGEGAKGSARLYYRTIGEVDPAGEPTFARLEWPAPGTALPPGSPPFTMGADASVDFRLPAWAWRSAPVVSPASLDAPIRALVLALHRDLSNGRTQSTLAVNRTKVLDFCRAYGLDPAGATAEGDAELRAVISAGDFHLDPLDLGALTLRSIADGRMVDVLGADAESPIRAGEINTPSFFSVPLRIGVTSTGNLESLC